MQETTTTTHELDEAPSPLLLWKESVGKVFKLTSKSYGIRTVTYTHVKGVREAENTGDFDIDVYCAEITARVLISKRDHSSMCKEGVIHQSADSIITPGSFGEECQLEEFEKVAAAILTYTTTNLDRLMQHDEGEEPEIEASIDLPHLKLTDMEASLVRNSPFLIRDDIYLLSPNSRKAGLESINLDLQRAIRNTRLTDACDPVYVAQKNDAVNSLRQKLASPAPEATVQKNSLASSEGRSPASATPTNEKSSALNLAAASHGVGTNGSKHNVSAGGQVTNPLIKKQNRIALALLGEASAASLSWERQNPSKEGAVFRIGKDCGLIEFVRWAHVSGRTVTDQESANKKVRTYFSGPEGNYTGPDKDGIYPLFKLESEA